MITFRLLSILCVFAVAPAAIAAELNPITPTLPSVEVMHQGRAVAIVRNPDPNGVIPELFQKTYRGCPPFCVQPLVVAPGVETIGELDVLDYLQRRAQGDDNILVVDSRTPDWVMRGTIPGAVNIPWNTITSDKSNAEATDLAAEVERVLTEQLGVQRTATGNWDFAAAKTVVLFCNGIWCQQSTHNIKTLLTLGYPAAKLKWYRGGMQDWVSVGLTTVEP